ncbi:MAG: DUF1697 domain-containing protein [Brumimicrobium sp.]
MATQHIIFLKGINVGGNNIIRMEELRNILSQNSFEKITTVIQSGNIILSSEKTVEEVKASIHEIIQANFDLNIPVIVSNKVEIEAALKDFPFYDKSDDESQLHITFLEREVTQEEWNERFLSIITNESYKLNKRILYLFTPKGYHKSKLNASTIASKLGVNATNRNLKTLKKVLDKTN